MDLMQSFNQATLWIGDPCHQLVMLLGGLPAVAMVVALATRCHDQHAAAPCSAKPRVF